MTAELSPGKRVFYLFIITCLLLLVVRVIAYSHYGHNLYTVFLRDVTNVKYFFKTRYTAGLAVYT